MHFNFFKIQTKSIDRFKNAFFFLHPIATNIIMDKMCIFLTLRRNQLVFEKIEMHFFIMFMSFHLL